MAKYYIQSGSVSFVVGACDGEGAALWVMHRVMDRNAAEYEAAKSQWEALTKAEADMDLDSDGSDADLVSEHELAWGCAARQSEQPETPQAIPYDAMLEGLSEFAERILISEIGHGHDDAGDLATEDIFRQWRQLMLAVDRLHDELG